LIVGEIVLTVGQLLQIWEMKVVVVVLLLVIAKESYPDELPILLVGVWGLLLLAAVVPLISRRFRADSVKVSRC